VNSFNLELPFTTDPIPTRYSNNVNDSNLVIDLMFLHSESSELKNHSIHLDWQLTLDYAPLTITIPIVKDNVNTTKCLITKDSKEEVSFVKKVIASVGNLNMSSLPDIASLDSVVNEFASAVNNIWEKNSKIINVTKYSKS